VAKIIRTSLTRFRDFCNPLKVAATVLIKLNKDGTDRTSRRPLGLPHRKTADVWPSSAGTSRLVGNYLGSGMSMILAVGNFR
jgi:hypothetical protein